MLRNLIVCFFFCLSCLEAVSQEITVATFNAEFLNKSKVHIKFGLPYDLSDQPKKEQKFWNDESNRGEKFREATANVAKFIQQINADILTLTEVGNKSEIQVLIDELSKIGVSYAYWQVCACTDTFTGQHVAVLSKFPLKEVWPEIPGRSIYLEETDGDSEGETGISKGLKVTATIGEKDIDIFVLHFKSERGGFDSDAQRLAQASIARRAIIKQLNEGRKVIVTGDLNSEKGTESLYRIRGFDDIYEELIQTGHSEYFENKDVRWTYDYLGEREQIDHILVSPGLTSKTGIKTSIIHTNDAQVSDHNPVIVRLKVL